MFLNVISCTRADKLSWYGIVKSLSFAYNHFTPNSSALLHNILHVTVFKPIPFSASIQLSEKLLNILFCLSHHHPLLGA